MDIDYNYFVSQRKDSAAWNILCAQRAPLLLTFVHEAFILQGRSSAPESELCSFLRDLIIRVNNSVRSKVGVSLDDDVGLVYAKIEELKKQEEAAAAAEEQDIKAGKTTKRRSKKTGAGELSLLVEDPMHFLQSWSSEDSLYFRCTHQQSLNGVERYYDITPQLQKAYSFAVSLQETAGSFVPTESRLKNLLSILKEVQDSTEGNAQSYIEDLERQKAELDRKLELAKKGVIATLSPAQLRERFVQFQHDAISLVDDFRQVEYNLMELDKEILQDILGWTGPRGDLLAKYFGKNDYIEHTDQGRSVKAFAHLLLSSDDDDQIVNQIRNLLSLPEVQDMVIDDRLYTIHDQWLNQRLNIERVMGASNRRIKSFLLPQNLDANIALKALINNIFDNVSDISKKFGLAPLLTAPPLLDIELPQADIQLPFDRTLYVVNEKMEFNTNAKADSFAVVDDKLFNQVVVDTGLLLQHIIDAFEDRDQVTLKEIIDRFPLHHGVAELTTYIKIALVQFDGVENPNIKETLSWESFDIEGNQVLRKAVINQITLNRR